MTSNPMQREISVPVDADSVDSPVITYEQGLVALDFRGSDYDTWWRTSFEGLDSLKISRGEYDPYPFREDEQRQYRWVSIVEDSPWLAERYRYEKGNYGDSYNFGGDVDEMLSEYQHYVFHFHDEFVEVIAKGMWFELLAGWNAERIPLSDLGESANIEKRECHGITYQIRTNSKPTERLIEDARLCSQKLMQFAAELDGDLQVSWSATLRARGDQLVTSLRGYFGNPEKTYDGVATLDQILPHIESWLLELSNRRREMGKD